MAKRKVTWTRCVVVKDEMRDSIMSSTVKSMLDEKSGRYPPHIYEAAKKYRYTNLARDFGKSSEAIHKWFRLARIPAEYLEPVAEKLNLPVGDFKKEFRGDIDA